MLRAAEARLETSQREVAECMGASLGKADYSLKALVGKGWVKVRNFRNSKGNLAHAYLLTYGGVAPKATLTVRLLTRKVGEALRREIEALNTEPDGRA